MIRCQIVLPGRTGIPEDQFVNTIYVTPNGAYNGPAVADDLAEAVSVAYMTNGFTGGPSNTLNQFMSPFIDRTLCSVRVYDMNAPKPRPPSTAGWTLGAPAAGSPALPEEVALCLSIYGAPPRTARRRGRLYIGPLSSWALDGGANQITPARPKVIAMQTVRNFGAALRSSLAAAGYTWQIKSEVPSTNYVAVEGGYCDDAWDTQRRRGVDPVTRWSFPASP